MEWRALGGFAIWQGREAGLVASVCEVSAGRYLWELTRGRDVGLSHGEAGDLESAMAECERAVAVERGSDGGEGTR